MTKKKTDPIHDIYTILDEVGLNPGNLLATRKPMSKLINTMRGDIARKVKDYIEAREHEGNDNE